MWLDPSGKQLLQWPVEEVEALRGKSVTLKGRVLKPGQHLEVTGLQTAQVRRACLLATVNTCRIEQVQCTPYSSNAINAVLQKLLPLIFRRQRDACYPGSLSYPLPVLCTNIFFLKVSTQTTS